MEIHRIIFLYDLNRRGEASEAEQQELRLLMEDEHAEPILKNYWDKKWDELSDTGEDDTERLEEIFERIIAQKKFQRTRKRFPYPYAIAATLAILFGVGLVYYRLTHHSAATTEVASLIDAAPGRDLAVLMLADGRKIRLSASNNGKIAEESGVNITKTANGQIFYQPRTDQGENSDGRSRAVAYNTISTPSGGKYCINLPDGSKVWLNAATTLKFPSDFAGLKARRVELSGEAYFEVAHNKSIPFIVKTAAQEVLVLGTHFNINSYGNELETKTTLLEGKVMVRPTSNQAVGRSAVSVVLKPGEMATLRDSVKVDRVDPDIATAWKDGNFLFDETDLRSILRQLERWYSVKVDYNSIPEGRSFNGLISREVKLSKVLEMLELTGRIKFETHNGKINVKSIKN